MEIKFTVHTQSEDPRAGMAPEWRDQVEASPVSVLCAAPASQQKKINSQGQKRDPISELFKALGLEMGHNPLGDSYDKELGFEHSPSNQPLPESRKQRIGLPFRFQRPVNHNGILLAIKPMK